MANISLTTAELTTLYNMILVERMRSKEISEHKVSIIESIRLKVLKAFEIEVVPIMEKHFGDDLKNCRSQSAQGRNVKIVQKSLIDLCNGIYKK